MLAWENTVLQFRIQLGDVWIAFCRPYPNCWRLFTACLVNLWMYNMYHIYRLSSGFSPQLDDGNAINDMKLETIGSNKQLFVSTNSKIYRLPLERCSRHLTCRCASLAYYSVHFDSKCMRPRKW